VQAYTKQPQKDQINLGGFTVTMYKVKMVLKHRADSDYQLRSSHKAREATSSLTARNENMSNAKSNLCRITRAH
jgi:hypothetical protein